MSMKLHALPPKVVSELCKHLNIQGAGVKNWKELITLVPGTPYDIFAADSFVRNGMQPYSSPADQVIADFIARGISVDTLYCMLAEMEAEGCMAVLKNYVSASVVNDVEKRKEEQLTSKLENFHFDLQDVTSSNSTTCPSPEVHPQHGPLPTQPPDSSTENRQTLPLHPTTHQHPSPLPSPPASSHPSSATPSSSQLREQCPSGHVTQYPSGHVTSSSSVFTYSSSLTSTEPYSSSRSSVSEQSNSSSGSLGSKCSMEGALNILHFSYAELSEATDGFTEGMVGIGSFGTVFKAEIRGNGPYAIKKLHTEAEMGLHCGPFYESFHRETFFKELQLLTRYHHRNILSLIAFSNDGYKPCLIYEYMANGSLAECLEGKREVCLQWDLRLSIATQVANALHFLHTVNLPTSLVHGDIKSANILLDTHFVPKLSDFGLARELTSKNSKSTISTRSSVMMGTLAYMAPEFIRNKKLTTRTDVYAFGVVLLELYTGQPAFSNDPAVKERVLTDRLSELLEESDGRKEEVLMSADVRAGWPRECALCLFDIITVCLQRKQRLRLPIKQVVDQLLILPQ